jgi:hypothetical protein
LGAVILIRNGFLIGIFPQEMVQDNYYNDRQENYDYSNGYYFLFLHKNVPYVVTIPARMTCTK